MRGIELDEGHSGVGRLHFFLGKVGLFAVWMVAVNLLGPESSWVRVIGLVLSYVSFWLDVMRLRCSGLSRGWAVLRFVPYANLLYLIFLQSAQMNWAETRRLDRTGKTLMISQLALVALMIFMLLRMSMAVPWMM
jgi:hypothetical protein